MHRLCLTATLPWRKVHSTVAQNWFSLVHVHSRWSMKVSFGGCLSCLALNNWIPLASHKLVGTLVASRKQCLHNGMCNAKSNWGTQTTLTRSLGQKFACCIVAMTAHKLLGYQATEHLSVLREVYRWQNQSAACSVLGFNGYHDLMSPERASEALFVILALVNSHTFKLWES